MSQLTFNSKVLPTVTAIIVLILVCPALCSNAQAQTGSAFSPGQTFSIPAYNGTVRFAVNGSYQSAALENNAWIFSGLQLNGSQALGSLQVSTKNSNITVLSYTAANGGFQTVRLEYFASGKGVQVFNLGLGPNEPQYYWICGFNNWFAGEGDGWTISPNATVTVTGQTGNISIVRYNFGGTLTNSNLPYYEQHSVAIAVAAIVAATIVLAVTLQVTARRSAKKAVEQENKRGKVEAAA